MDYTNPNFVGYANSYGAVGHKLERTEDLPKLLQTCLSQKAVHLVDVPISYASSDQELNVELKEIVKGLRAERAAWKVPAPAPKPQPAAKGASAGPPSLGAGPLATEPNVTGTLKEVWPIYVGDEASTTANLLDVTDKFTNEVICKVSLGAASDVDRAIRLA